MSMLERLVKYTYSKGADLYYKRFIKDTFNAGDVNRRVLKEILTGNSETSYGSLYNFADIQDTDDYRGKVPLTNYSDYTGYIDEIAAGAENILTSDRVRYFGLSSGTTGTQKRIPITARFMSIANRNMMFLQQGALADNLPAVRKGGRGLLLINMLQSRNSPREIPTGAGTAGGMKAMQKMLRYFWTSPPEILVIPDQQTVNYLHLLFALRERNLAYITSPFSSSIVHLFGVLEQKWPEITEDIARGRISPGLSLEPEQRDLLEKQLKADPFRARELEAELRQGLQDIAPRVWPRMTYICCVVGGSFGIYLDRLRYYIGNLPVFSGMYGATEALVGIAPRLNDVNYIVTPRSAFYEFIPLAESFGPAPATYDLDQLKVGDMYEVVITNHAGFYRYRLEDVVKVVDYYNQSPVLEFMYRKGQLLNAAAEKTSEQAVQQALVLTARDMGLVLTDYTAALDFEGTAGNYRFYIEIDGSAVAPEQALKMRDILEHNLGDANPRYLAGLKVKQIAPLEIRLVKSGAFEVLKQELVERGVSVNQVKIPRYIKDPLLIRMLEENVQ